MKSNSRNKTQMRNVTPSEISPSSTSNYCPSVPISVYRELAAELQAAQAMLDSLNNQNQQLSQQNQKLRQDLEQVINSATQMQQVVAGYKFGNRSATAAPGYTDSRSPQVAPTFAAKPPSIVSASSVEYPQVAPAPAAKPPSIVSASSVEYPEVAPAPALKPSSIANPPRQIEISSPPLPQPDAADVIPVSEKLFTEQEEGRYRRPTAPERGSDIGGFWLIVAILLIVATAFGTGFLIVRPLLLKNSR